VLSSSRKRSACSPASVAEQRERDGAAASPDSQEAQELAEVEESDLRAAAYVWRKLTAAEQDALLVQFFYPDDVRATLELRLSIDHPYCAPPRSEPVAAAVPAAQDVAPVPAMPVCVVPLPLAFPAGSKFWDLKGSAVASWPYRGIFLVSRGGGTAIEVPFFGGLSNSYELVQERLAKTGCEIDEAEFFRIAGGSAS
jgi:hypothetical protein